MTSPVNQMHVSFVPAHDRLLLRLATADRREVRLWMTRRFVKTLWPVLLDALQADPALAGHADPAVRREVLSFQYDQAIRETEFTKAYHAPPDNRPLTAVPMLLSRARCESLDAGRTRLELITARERSFHLTLDRKTIHSLCKLIADCAANADWHLGLSPAGPGEAAPAPSGRTLN